MSTPFQGDGSRPPSAQPISILSVRFPEVHYVRFLGPWRQLGTHYGEKHCIVCLGLPDDPGRVGNGCPKERHKLPYRSKWFVPAQVFLPDEQVWRRTVVEITEAMERKMRSYLPLRGQVWTLRRANRVKAKKELLGDFIEKIPLETLPEPFDVDPILRRAFKELELPAPGRNLLPERPYSEDEPGLPPKGLVLSPPAEAPPATVSAPSSARSWREASRQMRTVAEEKMGDVLAESLGAVIENKVYGANGERKGGSK